MVAAETLETNTRAFEADGSKRPGLARRAARTLIVACAWVAAFLPTALGWERCPTAMLFHRPCPGCGMTRAIRLFASGRLGDSFRMHPLAIPVLGVGIVVVFATLRATLATGSPFEIHRFRSGRVALVLGVAVSMVAWLIWTVRGLGYLGGPVPV